jgi:hypothetical protein
MPEPITLSLAAVGSVALTEGVKFLYQQAGEILKNWRTRKQAPPAAPEPAPVVLPPVFDGQLTAPAIHYDAVSQVEPELRSLHKDLGDYATEVAPIDDLAVAKIDALRQALEAIYRQHITFKGENRPASGALLVGTVEAGEIAGEAIGVDVQGRPEGEIRGTVKAGRIEPGGKATGVKNTM